MTSEELKGRITAMLPAATAEDAQWPAFNISAADWPVLAPLLRSEKDLSFDYLFCVTCADWKTHLTMIYHLCSVSQGHTIIVRAKIGDRNDPHIASVASIWRTAEFHEREAYDLFGVKFNGHPDLRRLFLTDDWKGWPLRKDYEDEINMVKL